MDREEALGMFLNEVKRLNTEEHVDDWSKCKRYDKLARIECHVCNALMAYVAVNDLKVRTEEIQKGSFFAATLLLNIIGVNGLLYDEEGFAMHLAQEGGELEKSIARRVFNAESGKDVIANIPRNEFFDDSYANANDDEYGEE